MPNTSHVPAELVAERANNFRTTFDGKSMHSYAGLPIFAAPGVHQAAAALLQAVAAMGARVLEFGAGSGAMSQRLTDLGFVVTASDLFPESFKATGATFVAADLNGAFSDQWPKGFDVVMALEILEHLENPRQVLRHMRQLLPKGGTLVLSTPNIANPVSQALFLRRGQFQWFRDTDYHEQGHITPLSPWMLEKALQEAGFVIRHERAVSSPFRRLRKLGLAVCVLAPLMALFSGQPRARRGEIWLVQAEAV